MEDIYYYLIPAEALEEASQYAAQDGLPYERMQVRLSTDGTLAIVQARWTDLEAMDRLGTRLGKLLPDGQAEEAVYRVLSDPVWNNTEPIDGGWQEEE